MNKLLLCTAFLNGCVLVGIGHGMLPLGLLELADFPYYNSEYFSFRLSSSYESTVDVACLISLLAQVTFIVSVFIKGINAKTISAFAGLFFCWFGFFYLVQSSLFFGSATGKFSLVSGIPFLCVSIWLLIRLIKQITLDHNKTSYAK